MSLSVNTNMAAMVALQNLNATNSSMNAVQNHINTGLKVAGAKDNSAVYAIAQNARGAAGALDAIKQGVSRGSSIVDIAVSAGETISDLLVQMKQKAVAADDPSLDPASRQALNEDFHALIQQIQSVTQNASFDGANLLDGSLPSGLVVLADANAQNTITIGTESLSLGGSIISLTANQNVLSQSSASIALAQVDASTKNVNAALARLGSAGKKLDQHLTFLGKLQDAFNGAIGNMVDADMAQESAKLQALQVKQQLGVQALSIANSQPQLLLSLFRGS
jgi:flagellin